MTATSVVPPPMSTTMLPCGSATGSPAPIAAAIGSSIRYTPRAPAPSVDGDDRRLEDDDPFAADEDERVRGPEIDRQLPAGEGMKAHQRRPRARLAIYSRCQGLGLKIDEGVGGRRSCPCSGATAAR